MLCGEINCMFFENPVKFMSNYAKEILLSMENYYNWYFLTHAPSTKYIPIFFERRSCG